MREKGEGRHFVRLGTWLTPNALWQGSMSESRLNITPGLSRRSETDAILVDEAIPNPTTWDGWAFRPNLCTAKDPLM